MDSFEADVSLDYFAPHLVYVAESDTLSWPEPDGVPTDLERIPAPPGIPALPAWPALALLAVLAIAGRSKR